MRAAACISLALALVAATAEPVPLRQPLLHPRQTYAAPPPYYPSLSSSTPGGFLSPTSSLTGIDTHGPTGTPISTNNASVSVSASSVQIIPSQIVITVTVPATAPPVPIFNSTSDTPSSTATDGNATSFPIDTPSPTAPSSVPFVTPPYGNASSVSSSWDTGTVSYGCSVPASSVNTPGSDQTSSFPTDNLTTITVSASTEYITSTITVPPETVTTPADTLTLTTISAPTEYVTSTVIVPPTSPSATSSTPAPPFFSTFTSSESYFPTAPHPSHSSIWHSGTWLPWPPAFTLAPTSTPTPTSSTLDTSTPATTSTLSDAQSTSFGPSSSGYAVPPAPSGSSAAGQKEKEKSQQRGPPWVGGPRWPPPVDRRDAERWPPRVDRRGDSGRWGWTSVEKAVEKKEREKEGNVEKWSPRVDRRGDPGRWGWTAVEKAVEKNEKEKGE